MRALTWVFVSGLIALWGWFALEVAPGDGRRPVALAVDGDTAAELNNQGVALDRQGRPADALAYFERARDFRPLEPVFAANAERQRQRVEMRGWIRFLVPASAVALVLLVLRGLRGLADRARLRGLHTRGESFVRILPGDERVELPLRFNAPVEGLLSRHPLTVVWSCAGQGKHMKSRPPVKARGDHATIRLDGERMKRLQRHPGDWRAFLYMGKTAVGEAAARVG